ncbi:hypothetical protein GCM10010464_84650 [Pseudonocardia yunnanensis]
MVGGEDGVEPGALRATADLLQGLAGRDPEDVEGEPEVTNHSDTLSVLPGTHNGVRRARTRPPPPERETIRPFVTRGELAERGFPVIAWKTRE